MKSKYKEVILDNIELINKWVQNGLLNNEIIENLGISQDTFYTYKKEHPELAEILTRTREIPTDNVEGALYSSCLGKKVILMKPIKVKRKKYEGGKVISETEEIVQSPEEMYIPPDVDAQKFWLKNQRPAVWRDNPVDKSSEDEANKVLTSLVDAIKGASDKYVEDNKDGGENGK